MRADILKHYERINVVYRNVKGLKIEKTTIHMKVAKPFAESFIGFWQEVHGVDKNESFSVDDRGDLVIIEQGKLSLIIQIKETQPVG